MGEELAADQTTATPLMHISPAADEQQVFKACEPKSSKQLKKKRLLTTATTKETMKYHHFRGNS